jgi:hypothetical protein
MLRHRSTCALNLFIALLVTFTSARANVVISDDDFTPAEWVVSVTVVTGGATHAESRPATGGNPAEYRHMTHTLPGSSSITITHLFIAGVYHPWIDGPITSIDFREDRSQAAPPFPGASVGAAPLIVQDGISYFGPSTTFTNTSWSTSYLTSLSASDFTSATNTHPDFSVCGGPLQFGFTRSNSNAGGSPIATNHGIDNFAVTVRNTLTGVGSTGAAPASIRVVSANPFAGAVTLELTPGRFGQTVVAIYDVSGRLVRRLEDRELWGEITDSRWDGKDDNGRSVPSGVYFARMQIGNSSVQQKLIVVR